MEKEQQDCLWKAVGQLARQRQKWRRLRVKWSVGKWAVPVIINVLTFFMLTPPLKTPCGLLFFASCNILHYMFVSFYICIPIPIFLLLLNFSHMSQMQVSEMLCTLQDVAHVSKMLCRVVGGAGIGEGVRVAGWGRANNGTWHLALLMPRLGC